MLKLVQAKYRIYIEDGNYPGSTSFNQNWMPKYNEN